MSKVIKIVVRVKFVNSIRSIDKTVESFVKHYNLLIYAWRTTGLLTHTYFVWRVLKWCLTSSSLYRKWFVWNMYVPWFVITCRWDCWICKPFEKIYKVSSKYYKHKNLMVSTYTDKTKIMSDRPLPKNYLFFYQNKGFEINKKSIRSTVCYLI